MDSLEMLMYKQFQENINFLNNDLIFIFIQVYIVTE